MPPERIWHHQEQLEEWFAAVKQRREDRAKGLETIPDADDEHTLHNALTEGLRN